MKTLFETEFGWSLIKIALGLILSSILVLSLSSCGPDRRLAHTPSRREIRKAMSYSTSEYYMGNTTHPVYNATAQYDQQQRQPTQ